MSIYSNRFVEALERRKLLSATFTMKDGRLTIDADDAANDITVTLTPDKVFTITVDGVTEDPYFQNKTPKGAPKRRVIRRLRIIGNGGDDNILLQSLPFADDPLTEVNEAKKARDFSIPTTLIGGDGNDTIQGADSSDTIVGGAGDDLLIGGLGKDLIYGGSGNDTIQGGSGKNVLIGQDGDDLLIGGRDRDLLYGMLGDDTYEPGGGRNTIFVTGPNETINDAGNRAEVRREDYDDFVELYANRLIRLTLPEQYRDFARQ